MSTINTQYRNYVFPLKDEDLESSNNLLRITTEAIDSDINTLFVSKANSADVDTSTTVDTKISAAISSYDGSLDIYGTYINGDVVTDPVEKNKLNLLTVMATPGTHTKVTVNEKGLVTAGANIVKSDLTDFVETDYVHINGTETISGDKTFTGNVILPPGTNIDSTALFDDTATTSTTKGYSVSKLNSTFVPLTSFSDANVLTKILNVDGNGSGLDSDLLDGQEGSYYVDWMNFSNTPTTIAGYGITGGASGSFTASSGETVTVVDGLITSIV